MEKTTECKRCGKTISNYILSIQNKPDSTEWVRNGFCSHSCFAEFAESNQKPIIAEVITKPVVVSSPGMVYFGEESVLVPIGEEKEALNAWKRVSLGKEANMLVNRLLEIAKTDGLTSLEKSEKFDADYKNIEAYLIGQRIYEIGGNKLMIKAWWRVEVEKYRTGLRASRDLDFCWDGIGSWQS